MTSFRRFVWAMLLVSLTCISHGQEEVEVGASGTTPPVVPTVAPVALTSLSATAARADVVAMRSMVRPSLLKGGFGEAHMERHLARYLRETGEWLPLGARLGAQGIDGLMVRYDTGGDPRGLIVSEAKYGTSRLGTTRDGIQMGVPWRSSRLARLAAEYRSIADSIGSGRMEIAGPGGSVGRQRLQIPLADGKKVAVFARSRPGDPWEFVGPRELMPEAGRQSRVVGRYLQLASEGRVAYESAIYRVEMRGNSMVVTIKDAARLGPIPGESGLPVLKTFPIALTGARVEQLRELSRGEVARLLRRVYPRMIEADVQLYSREIVRSTREFRDIFSSSPRSWPRAVVHSSLWTGVVGAGLDVAIQAAWQLHQAGRVDSRSVATSGAVTLLGTAGGAGLGQWTAVVVVRNPIAYQFMQRTSLLLGLGSTGLVTNGLGSLVGGGFASIFIAYGGWIAGLYDARTANRMAAAGSAAAVAATAFGVGVFSLASAIGTASTGTAIASLGGAAATNAALAWLGGGSLAAGGFGVLGGSVVLTGGIAIVAVGAGAAVYACFRYADEKQDLERIRLTIEELRTRKVYSASGIGTQRFQMQTIPGGRGHADRFDLIKVK
jgi:hypothetical protein